MIDKEKQPNKTMLVVFIAGLTAFVYIAKQMDISGFLLSFCSWSPIRNFDLYALLYVPIVLWNPKKIHFTYVFNSSFGKEKKS